MTSNQEKIKSEIKKCKQALDDALYNLNDNRYLTAVNRLYYAAFYIVVAYFISKNILIKTHKGISIKLHSELLKTGFISMYEGETFDRLLKLRSEFDYGDFAIFDKNELKDLYMRTLAFISKIESLIPIHD